MKFFKLLIICLCLQLGLEATPPSFREQMKNSLDQVAFALEVYYAPANWKQEWHGWDLYFELSKAKDQIDQNPSITLKDYHRILRNFLASTKDYHVGVEFISTEEAYLPLNIKGAEGKFYISTINRAELPLFVFPYQVGDEVITFNGKPILHAIQQIEKEEVLENLVKTDRRLAEKCLTYRSGSRGHIVPSGKATLGILPKGKTKPVSVDLQWNVFNEQINPPFKALSRSMAFHPQKETFKTKFPRLAAQKMMMAPFKKSKFAGKEDIGSKVGFLPALGKKIWSAEEESSFSAYIYLNDKGDKIGYLRIPHYVPEDNEVEELASILSYFQANTKALVLDQTNNPGGSILYLFTLISMLTDKPLDAPTQRALLTQEDIIEAVALVDLIGLFIEFELPAEIISDFFDGMDVNTQTLLKIKEGYKQIINEWNSERFLTDSFNLYGLDTIPPSSKCNYTRPILMLINELDFSCADFLPAFMQDNKRATLFGATTAGAGGYVLSHGFPNRLGIQSFRTTGSILLRKNGTYIENQGVTPDISYEISGNDLKENYVDMKKAINQAVNSL